MSASAPISASSWPDTVRKVSRPKKSAREVDAPPSPRGGFAGVEGGHAEHLAGALGVGRRDDRRVQVDEAALLEEVVDRARGGVAHAQHRADRVGARPQVGDGAQELEGVALLLQRVVVLDAADHLHALAPCSSKRWPLPGDSTSSPADLDRAAGAERAAPRISKFARIGLDHDLQAGEARAVADLEKGDALRVTRGAHPAAHRRRAAGALAGQDLADRFVHRIPRA